MRWGTRKQRNPPETRELRNPAGSSDGGSLDGLRCSRLVAGVGFELATSGL